MIEKRFSLNTCLIRLLYSHGQLYKHITHIHLYMHAHLYAEHNDDTIMMSDTVFLEKYNSHFIWKSCVWEGVGDRTELQHIDPHSYGHQRFFPVLLGCSTRGLGPSLSGYWFSLSHLISPAAQSGGLGPTLLGAGFLYRILSPTGLVSKLTDFLSSPSYIIA